MNILVVDVTTLISITCFTGNVPKYEHVTAFDWDHFERQQKIKNERWW